MGFRRVHQDSVNSPSKAPHTMLSKWITSNPKAIAHIPQPCSIKPLWMHIRVFNFAQDEASLIQTMTKRGDSLQ